METLSCAFEVKFDAAGADVGTFSGYGAVFGNVDSWGDVIAKGAFKETLREAKKTGAWPSLLSQHGGWGMSADDLMPIGVWTDMREDDTGLYVEGKLALDTQRGKDAYALLKMAPRPALNGLSIGYQAKEWSVGTKPDEPRRTLKKIHLFEVSLVTFPANPKARVASIKSAGGNTIRDAERALRDAGFSVREAKAILADGFKALDAMRDAGDGLAELAASLNRGIALRQPLP